jgi:hypothetical protein
MDHQVRLFRVFIASPSDLGDERKCAREVVEELNAIFSKETDQRIELLGWEDTLPGSGRPQSLINEDLDKADLFIGCLWQRMGSPAGPTGKTGFEEEFERALTRNTADGTPEMWLFLKEIDAARAADPGEQLRRVLEFRKEQEAAKRLLFKEFKDVGSWRELLYGLLLPRLIQAVTHRPTGTKDDQSSGIAPSQNTGLNAEAPKAVSKKGELAFSSLADVLDLAAGRVRSEKLLVPHKTDPLPPESSARLLLFAAANYDWNSQHIEFGTHEINSVYYHREEVTLTGQERLFILRTILLDTSQTKPGWYWINQWSAQPKVWIPYLAISDSEDSMRLAVVQLATRTGFPLHKGKVNSRPIGSILKDTSAGVRIAGLNFLSLHGVARDESIIRSLFADPDKEVRVASERALRTLRLRLFPDPELQRIIRERDTFDEVLVDVLNSRASLLRDRTLFDAVSHPSGALRALAARELFSRSHLTKELALQFSQDEARAVRQIGYTFLADNGDVLNLDDVKAALKASYLSNDPSWNKADSKPVILAALKRLSGDDLWKKVFLFTEESAPAIQILESRSSGEMRKVLRELISGGLESLAADLKALRPVEKVPRIRSLLPLFGPFDPIDEAKEEIETTILELLAEKPESEDRTLFLRYISKENPTLGELLASLRGLAMVGVSDDRSALTTHLKSKSDSTEAAASMTFLALSSSNVAAANELLAAPTKTKVLSVVSHAIKAGDKAVWVVLEPLLKSEDEDIRRAVCYFAIRMKSKKELARLHDQHLKSGRYFYNVVVMLDRELYAPREFATLFLSDVAREINEPTDPIISF